LGQVLLTPDDTALDGTPLPTGGVGRSQRHRHTAGVRVLVRWFDVGRAVAADQPDAQGHHRRHGGSVPVRLHVTFLQGWPGSGGSAARPSAGAGPSGGHAALLSDSASTRPGVFVAWGRSSVRPGGLLPSSWPPEPCPAPPGSWPSGPLAPRRGPFRPAG